MRYQVKYYDPKANLKKEKSIKVRLFDTQVEAEQFASGYHLYGKPAKAEPYSGPALFTNHATPV